SFGAGGFVRHNCCLYYRVPGGGMCGDCGLR
ncbi:ferric iron reductase, partial [Actinomadura sp. 7K507]